MHPQAIAYAKVLSDLVNNFKIEEKKYYDKFVKGNAVPTQHDVTAIKNFLAMSEKTTTDVHVDLNTVARTIQTFGGPSDTFLHSLRELVGTIEHNAHPH